MSLMHPLRPAFHRSLVGRLEECVHLWYRTPASSVERLVPPGFSLVTYEDQGREWAFWNVTVMQLRGLRRRFVPRFAGGVDGRVVSYRLLLKTRVAVSRPNGDTGPMGITGLFAVRTDCDRAKLRQTGPLVCGAAKPKRAKISLQASPTQLRFDVQTKQGHGDLRVNVITNQKAGLESGSLFADVEDAQSILSDRALRFIPAGDGGERLEVAEIITEPGMWVERPVKVVESRLAYFEALGQDDAHLEMAVQIQPVDAMWGIGRPIPICYAPRLAA